MRKLRASILILGPILARTGSACVGLPVAAPSVSGPLICI